MSVTRKKTSIPFIGQPGPLPNFDLPSNSDIIKCLRQMQSTKHQSVESLISCPMSRTDSSEASCQDSNCCLLNMVKQKWNAAGFPTISDRCIQKKIKDLHNVHSSLRESRPGPKATLFLDNAPKLFDIAHPDLITIIEKDRNRTPKAKEEDIDFYKAKLDGKFGKLGNCEDLQYKEKVDKKLGRLRRETELREKERLMNAQDQSISLDDGTEEEDNEENIYSDYEPIPKKIRKEKKPDFIALNLPRKTLGKLTAPLARRYKISPRAQTAFLAKIIKIGGGKVEDFNISRTTLQRQGKCAIKNEAQRIIQEKKEILKDKDIQLHFDGKSVKQFMDGKVEKKERVAVFASSPSMEREVLLGIPAVLSSSGANQVEGILPLIEKYDITGNIFSVNIDSTASNTGKWLGSATLLQGHVDSPYIWIICRHHLVETLARHGFDAIRGQTGSPFETQHNQFQNDWNNIAENSYIFPVYLSQKVNK